MEPRAPVPSVDQLFTTLQNLYAGRDSGQSSYSFSLTRQEYQLLQEWLSEDSELGRWHLAHVALHRKLYRKPYRNSYPLPLSSYGPSCRLLERGK